MQGVLHHGETYSYSWHGIRSTSTLVPPRGLTCNLYSVWSALRQNTVGPLSLQMTMYQVDFLMTGLAVSSTAGRQHTNPISFLIHDCTGSLADCVGEINNLLCQSLCEAYHTFSANDDKDLETGCLDVLFFHARCYIIVIAKGGISLCRKSLFRPLHISVCLGTRNLLSAISHLQRLSYAVLS